MIKRNPVLRVVTKILFAPIILYGLYVQFHGDYGPGGGFQAGVIVAAAFILYGIVFGLDELKKLTPMPLVTALMAAGGLLFAGVGVAGIVAGDEFLNYNHLAHEMVHGQHVGIILVEFGVGMTVSSVILGLYVAFAGYGR